MTMPGASGGGADRYASGSWLARTQSSSSLWLRVAGSENASQKGSPRMGYPMIASIAGSTSQKMCRGPRTTARTRRTGSRVLLGAAWQGPPQMDRRAPVRAAIDKCLRTVRLDCRGRKIGNGRSRGMTWSS